MLVFLAVAMPISAKPQLSLQDPGVRNGIGIPQTMFFQPAEGRMWDVFSMIYEEGVYYMYYLLNRPTTKQWDSVGIAVSEDGVTWIDRGVVLEKREEATWLGTGWVTPYTGNDPDGPKWVMNYSQWYGPFPKKEGESYQLIAFARSDDLLHWQTYPEDMDFRADARWYQPDRWDCIYPVPMEGGGYHGFWSGHPKSGEYGYAHGFSKDGLHWEASPPLVVEGFKGGAEIGAAAHVGGRWYLDHRWLNAAYILVGEALDGVFRPQSENFVFLERPGMFPRFFQKSPHELLCAYHHAGSGIWFAPMKRIRIDEDGTLRLKWWEGNEALKGKPIRGSVTAAQWNNGVVLEAEAVLPEKGFGEENLAVGAKVLASSHSANGLPGNVVDGRGDTAWTNARFFYSKGTEHEHPEWLLLDLGQRVSVGRIELSFGTLAKSARVEILLSEDLDNWRPVAAIDPSDKALIKVREGLSGEGRFLRFAFRERGDTPHGFMITEIRVFTAPRLDLAAFQGMPGLRIHCAGNEDGIFFAGKGGKGYFGRIDRTTGSIVVEKTFDRGIGLSGTVSLRFTGKASEYDIYLNDHLINPWTLPGRASGGVDSLELANVKVWSAVRQGR